MQVVRGCNDNSVGEFGPLKHPLPRIKTVLFRNAVLFRIAFVPNFNRLRHPNDVQFLGVLDGIIAIHVAAVSRPARNGRQGAFR